MCLLQVNVVEEYSTGELLLQTAQAALTVIKEYQVRRALMQTRPGRDYTRQD